MASFAVDISKTRPKKPTDPWGNVYKSSGIDKKKS